MKVAIKVVVGVVAAVVVVLAVFGYVRVQREVALFDSEVRKDHRLIGSTLALCLPGMWSHEGENSALELVTLADADRPGLRISWVYPNGTRTEPPLASVQPPAARASALAHHAAPAMDPEQDDYLVTHVPVWNDHREFLGAIEIAESLGPRNAYVRTTVWNVALATAVMSSMAAAAVLLIGVWLIGRPLNHVITKARRVGAGDLSRPLLLKQDDEIGQLASEMNAMCEQLTEANARASKESAARIAALEQLRHADRLITVGKLAAGIAHELGTPLNVVSGRAKMIQRGTPSPNITREYAQVIIDQAARMTSIIRQLLDFARRRRPKTMRVNLAAIAQSAIDLLGHMAEKHRVILLGDCEPVDVLGDVGQLEQVATNLIVNAVQASPEGGRVVISTGVENREPPGSENNRCAILRVRDFGLGMDGETASRVFEPFFTTKDVGQGAGLGLSVAHGIVEGHGGFITVESAPSEGAVFTVCLPLVEA